MKLNRWGRKASSEKHHPDGNARIPQTVGSGPQGYEYNFLQHTDEIRLLRILPSTQTGNGKSTMGFIHHTRLSNNPLYTAVSWMWGSQDLVNLMIQGGTVQIPVNLERILGYLQAKYQARDLWIDAICIDQNSVGERNHQVQLMGRIYSSANYVVSCLMANEPKGRKQLAATAKTIHQVFERAVKTSKPISLSSADRLSSEYRMFFQNPYFSRRWIIQEIIQARSVTLMCEGYQMPLSTLESMFSDGRMSLDARGRPSSALLGDQDMMRSGAMRLCWLRQEMNRTSLPLEQLLYLHEKAQCSDFRDRVYALLSLTDQAMQQLPVRYDIGRMELMLSVIMVAWQYEDLKRMRALSFTCFLNQHLKAATHQQYRFLLAGSPTFEIKETVQLQGVVRGKFVSHHISAAAQEGALQVRYKVPALTAYPVIHLGLGQPPAIGATQPATEVLSVVNSVAVFDTRYQMPVVHGIDQCLFAFDGDDSRGSANIYRERPYIAGLASSRIEVGDEIWQFERTPLAIIARRNADDNGYMLIGRAFLLQQLSTGSHADKYNQKNISAGNHGRFSEDDLIWVKEAENHGAKTPIIEVNASDLLKFMMWTTYET